MCEGSSPSDGSLVSLQEAMVYTLPVVVTDNAVIMEWVADRENGLMVPKKDEVPARDPTIFDIVFEGDLDMVMSCMASGPDGPSGPYEVRLFSRTGERLRVRAYPEKVVVGGRLKGIRCRFEVVDG